MATISLLKGKPAVYRHAISASLHQALVEVVGIPENDSFHLINELDPDNPGLHQMRWSREKAISYMIDTLGNEASSVTREVERYCVQPGQASSSALGWRAWTKARSRAEERLGDRFDLKDFHDHGLSMGSVPLDVFARVMEDWSGDR